MATSVYFDAHHNHNWTPVQTNTVNRISSMSHSKYQSDLDMKMESCINEWDGYSSSRLDEVESVLKWFIDSNYYRQEWLNNSIRRLLTSVRNMKSKLYNREKKMQTNTIPKKNVKEKTTNEAKVADIKPIASKKTASVSTDFPTFEDSSFPDTSKDIFADMLSKDSKMPKV